jgi:hypothetical protein
MATASPYASVPTGFDNPSGRSRNTSFSVETLQVSPGRGPENFGSPNTGTVEHPPASIPAATVAAATKSNCLFFIRSP